MSEFMPHLARPLWLLVVPLLGWLLWRLWHRKRRLGRWQALLPPAFQPWLLAGGRGSQDRLPWLLLGLAWLLTLVALLGPSWRSEEQPAQQLQGEALVAILELTPSMLAEDLPPNRLEQMRRKLLDLLAVRSEAPTAIVVYAGSAHVLVPLSNDLVTARNLLAALTPSLMPTPGQRADLAVQRALQLLDQGANGQGRLLLLTGALTPAEQTGIDNLLDGRSNPLLVLGVGTPAGAPVQLEDGGFLRDELGAILLPRLQAEQLAAFAASLGGGYSTLRLDNSDLTSLGLLSRRGGRSERGEALQRLTSWADQGYLLLLPLLLLAACAGRRGWLFAFTLLLVQPPPAQALEFADLWRRPDQRGLQMLEAGQPAAAAQHFSDPQWRGIAYYQAGDYSAAAAAFAEGDDAVAHYNRGNALARGGELESALEAYDEALRLDPQLSVAQRNRTLVAHMLEEAHPGDAGSSEQNAEAETDSEDAEAGTGLRSVTAPDDAAQAGQPKGQGQLSDSAASAASARSSSGAIGSGAAEEELLEDAGATELEHSDTPTPPAQTEQRQALEQWLRQIPDDPAELLRRKFWYEQQHQKDIPQ